VGDFGQRLLCWTAGECRRKKKVMGEKAGTESKDSQESNVGAAGWMDRFSNMKVGPPKGVKPATN